jgi:CO/xanthine dehydrogenase FAD-binding subunit
LHAQIQQFHRPSSLDEAIVLLSESGGAAIPVAGATEVGLRIRGSVHTLVDLSGLDLANVWIDDAGLHLGAMVRASQVYRDPEIRAYVGDALPESALAIAGETVRNLTSIGGNVVHLTSWSDMPPALQVLDASYRVQGKGRDISYTSEQFFAQQPKRLLQRGDLVTEIIVAPLPPNTGSAFIKHAKTAVDFALVNAAALITLDGDTVSEVRLSVGAIHTPPIRLTDAEGLVKGRPLTDALYEPIEKAVAAAVSPRRDTRASDAYLRHAAGVVVRRAAVLAAERAGGGSA